MVNAGCCAIHLAESSAGAAHFLMPRRSRASVPDANPPPLLAPLARTVKRNERLDLE